MFFVNIDKTDDSQLEFCGYQMVYAGVGFKLYRAYTGDEQIVDNAPPRYLKVEDLNDAECVRAVYGLTMD